MIGREFEASRSQGRLTNRGSQERVSIQSSTMESTGDLIDTLESNVDSSEENEMLDDAEGHTFPRLASLEAQLFTAENDTRFREGSRTALGSEEELNQEMTESESQTQLFSEESMENGESEERSSVPDSPGSWTHHKPPNVTLEMACRYCILCQAQFLPFRTESRNINAYWQWRERRQVQSWEYKFRAVLRMDSMDEEDIDITEPMTFPDIAGVSRLVAYVPSLDPSDRIAIRPNQSLGNTPHSEAFCFHDWCYSIFRWRVGAFSNATFYKVCKSLSISPAWENTVESEACIYNTTIINSLLSDTTELSPNYQPFFLSKLPAELRARIWEYVGAASAYTSFMIVAGETSRLFHHIHRATDCALTLYPNLHLIPKMIKIFGTDYIQSIHADSVTIPITDQEVACTYKLAIGTHGICAIKVISQYRSSAWIGKVPTSGLVWYADARKGPVLDRELKYTFKGLSIDVSKRFTSIKAIWDRADPPQWPKERSVFYYPLTDLDLYRCLPFYKGEEFAQGITFYFHQKYITGMEVHYKTSTEVVGCYSSVALHLPFAPGERIAYVWIKLEDNRYERNVHPAIIFRTTYGRTCYLGPYISPIDYRFYRWHRLNFHGHITGLCFQNFVWALNSINVTSGGEDVEPTEPLLDYDTPNQRPFPWIPGESGLYNLDVYFTDAKFVGMKMATLCRIDKRCMGILIEYLDSPPVVLGQWYKASVSQHQTIYDESHPPPSNMIFRSSGFEVSETGIVVDISFKQEVLPLEVNTDDRVSIFDLTRQEV
ncbi:hypothetical protein OCU04_004476 [Sclerotinia nivalis]|uniref:Uncharacterized protein n=1 Tax=Sclerotinia nivalis TaxID=352851 RepID=A0A9X0AQH5_9HELO|nr:hypothetical protein OCU04_004476 [Sclerotinia nivalis]